MKRYRLAMRQRLPALIEDSSGEYCLYSEANAVIGDLRRRLEDANAKHRSRQFRDGIDWRKFN